MFEVATVAQARRARPAILTLQGIASEMFASVTVAEAKRVSTTGRGTTAARRFSATQVDVPTDAR
jgi:hypothetical protein